MQHAKCASKLTAHAQMGLLESDAAKAFNKNMNGVICDLHWAAEQSLRALVKFQGHTI